MTHRHTCLKLRRPFLFAGLLTSALVLPAGAAELKPAKDEPLFDRAVPASVAELKVFQKRVKDVLEKVIPCTVGLQVGGASGSGVIISEDGYVLTAGHVSGRAGRNVTIILPDGKKVQGKTLGADTELDSGLIKIDESDRKWAFAEMGKSGDVKKSQWCIACGHPGGYQQGRSPVVRVGRVIKSQSDLIQTDCTLVGGDSGGPLFDLDGKVIGIHSRIGGEISYNIHVPVDPYRKDWDRLASSEVWGRRGIIRPPLVKGDPYLGLKMDEKCTVDEVTTNGPAEKAGLKVGDVILKFAGTEVKTSDDLLAALKKKKPAEKIEVVVRRDKETMTLKVDLGTRPSD